jgi:hypothetical protein
MATADKLIPPKPRAEIAGLDMPVQALSSLTYYRLTDVKYPSPLFWSRTGRYRFDSPTAKWGVCYAGETIASAFQEVFSDEIRKGDLNYASVAAYRVWSITVPATMKTIELAGPTLTAIRASIQSFTGRYTLSQEWGRALMLNKDDLDGLIYIGRRCGKPCLALFGDDAPNEKAHYQAALTVDPVGLLVEWKGFWSLINQLRVRFINLPPIRPKPTW